MRGNSVEREEETSRSRREVARRVEGLRRRLVARNALRSLAIAIPLLLLTWTILIVFSRLAWLDPLPARTLPALCLAVLVVCCVTGYIAAPRRNEVPLVLDRVLRTREVLTTACEETSLADHPLRREARRRAMELLSGPRPRLALPLTGWRAWRTLPLAATLLIGSLLLPQRATTASPDAAGAQQLIQVGEVLAQSVASLQTREDLLDAEELSEAVHRLEQLSAELRLGETADPEETLLALDSVDRLLDDYSKRLRAEARSDNRIEAALEPLVSNPFTEDLGRALESRDRQRLREALLSTAEALSSADLNEEEKRKQLEQVADLLSEVAKALRRQGLIDEAGVLDELAQALRDGDLDRASGMLRSTAMLDALGAIGQDQLGQEMARDLVEAVNLARYLLGQGRPLPLGEGCAKPGSSLARGPMPGTGSTNEEAEGFQAGDPVLRDRQTDATSNRRGTYEALYEPHIIEAESWVDVQVKAGTGFSGSFLTEIGRSAGTGDEASHPTRFVAAPAPGAPERAAELEHVPPGYRDVVRRYFARESAQPQREDQSDE